MRAIDRRALTARLQALAAFVPDPPPADASNRHRWHYPGGRPTIAETRRAIRALYELATHLGVLPQSVYDFTDDEIAALAKGDS